MAILRANNSFLKANGKILKRKEKEYYEDSVNISFSVIEKDIFTCEENINISYIVAGGEEV